MCLEKVTVIMQDKVSHSKVLLLVIFASMKRTKKPLQSSKVLSVQRR